METTAEQIIQQLQLIENIEGGYVRQTYRSYEEIDCPERVGGERPLSTFIYYLLAAQDYSAWHMMYSDEIWHHYHGADVYVHQLSEDGILTTHVLGSIANGAEPTLLVKGSTWMAAELAESRDENFALMGCSVSPGFDYKDFTLTDKQTLLDYFPQHSGIIERLATTMPTTLSMEEE